MSRALLALLTLLAACDAEGAARTPTTAVEVATECKTTCASASSTFDHVEDGQCVCARTTAPTSTACTALGCQDACAPGSCARWRQAPDGTCVSYCSRNWRDRPSLE